MHGKEQKEMTSAVWARCVSHTLGHQLTPVALQAGMPGDRLPARVVGQARKAGVAADQLQRVEHRPMGCVVRAELEDLEQADQPAPVVVGEGALSLVYTLRR